MTDSSPLQPPQAAPPGAASMQDEVRAFIDLCGTLWRPRIADLNGLAANGRSGRALQQRHALEFTLDRLAPSSGTPVSAAEQQLAMLAGSLARIVDGLTPRGREALRARIAEALSGDHALVPLFHLARIAALQQSRGFAVGFSALEDGAPFDLMLARDGAEAELSCETLSAEEGRDLHRSAWFNLVDGIDPDLQSWLADHPGRYLLKVTLPDGLRTNAATPSDDPGLGRLAELQHRIKQMLSSQRRADYDEAAMLRLDPLLLAGAQASELGLMDGLRREFGPEAQLAVTRSGNGVLVMAARAGRENDIGAALCRHMQAAAPHRFTGARPGILSMFLDDANRTEWRTLRDGLQLESQARQFLTTPAASNLVAVTASSRVELFGATGPDAANDGELRFRNQSHPAARNAALHPAISVSV